MTFQNLYQTMAFTQWIQSMLDWVQWTPGNILPFSSVWRFFHCLKGYIFPFQLPSAELWFSKMHILSQIWVPAPNPYLPTLVRLNYLIWKPFHLFCLKTYTSWPKRPPSFLFPFLLGSNNTWEKKSSLLRSQMGSRALLMQKRFRNCRNPALQTIKP